jgi:ferredoxin
MGKGLMMNSVNNQISKDKRINTLYYDPDSCINCGICSMVCPHGVFSQGEKAALLVKMDACMECGACQRNCPTFAIVVESGVGCAAAMFSAALRGKPMDSGECKCE